MALSDLVIQTEVIPVGKTSISVRGICASDVAYLYLNCREDVEQAAALWQSNNGDFSPEFMSKVLTQLPDFVARIIACAADEPDAWQNVKRMQLPTQLLAINAIGRLTFEGVGVKPFLEGVLVLMSGLNQGMAELNSGTPSTGTGG